MELTNFATADNFLFGFLDRKFRTRLIDRFFMHIFLSIVRESQGIGYGKSFPMRLAAWGLDFVHVTRKFQNLLSNRLVSIINLSLRSLV